MPLYISLRGPVCLPCILAPEGRYFGAAQDRRGGSTGVDAACPGPGREPPSLPDPHPRPLPPLQRGRRLLSRRNGHRHLPRRRAQETAPVKAPSVFGATPPYRLRSYRELFEDEEEELLPEEEFETTWFTELDEPEDELEEEAEPFSE
jgi:hypothetical protein